LTLLEAQSTRLFDGRVIALGGVVPIDGRISWISATASGYAPIHCFLLRETESALLIDTGVPIHERTIIGQLAEALDDDVELSIVLSRAVEYDSIGNCEAIIRSRPVRNVYAHFAVENWLSFQPRFDRVPRPSDTAVSFEILRPGTMLELDPTGGRTVELVQTPLRLLGTAWLYDHQTRVLFTSDAFGHIPLAKVTGSHAVDATSDTTNGEAVRDHLFTKFDWLLSADTSTISSELAAIFESRPIDAVAPAHGCIINGSDLVKRHHAMVQDALLNPGR
jgi:flavorubredoxin